MVLFLLADYATSLALSISLSIGKWVVYQSASGVYYFYRWMVPPPAIANEKEMDELDDTVVILTKKEYDDLLDNQNGIKEIQERLEQLEGHSN